MMLQPILSAPSNISSKATHCLICTERRPHQRSCLTSEQPHGLQHFIDQETQCNSHTEQLHFLIMVWSAHVSVEQASHHGRRHHNAYALSLPQERRGRLACSSVCNISLASCKMVLSALLRLMGDDGNRAFCINPESSMNLNGIWHLCSSLLQCLSTDEAKLPCGHLLGQEYDALLAVTGTDDLSADPFLAST